MSSETYPLFRDYSLVVKKWLQKTPHLLRLSRLSYDIVKITRTGTTDGGINQHEVWINTTSHELKSGHPVVLEDTTANDEYYMILKVVGAVIILDRNYRSLIADQTISGGKIKRTINVVYGNMQKAVSSVVQPLRDGLIDSPGIAFYISDYQYKVERSLPVENYYTRKYIDTEGNITKVAAVPPLLVYQLSYSINIWTVYQAEMDILVYQIISEFNPSKFFWVGDESYGLDFTGDRTEREHKGQWGQAVLENFNDVSDLEPGSATRTLRTEIGFMFTEAYIPQPFDSDQSMIGSIDFELVNEDRNTRCY